MYIISPLVFYSAEIIPEIGLTLFMLSFFAIFFILIYLVTNAAEGEDIGSAKRYLLIFTTIFIISTLFPSEKTIYKMFIAYIATTDKVKIATIEHKKLYNFIKKEINNAAKFIIDSKNK